MALAVTLMMLLSGMSAFAAVNDFNIITPYAMADAEFQSGSAGTGSNHAIKTISGTITPTQEGTTDNWFLRLTRASSGARFYLASTELFPATPVAQRYPGILFGVMHYEFDFSIPTVAAAQNVKFELYDSVGAPSADTNGWWMAPDNTTAADHWSAVEYTFVADVNDGTKLEMRAVDRNNSSATRVVGGLVPGTWYTLKGDINNSKRAHQFSIYPRGESTAITGGANINSPLRMRTATPSYGYVEEPRAHIGTLKWMATSTGISIIDIDNVKTVRDRFYCATPGVALADYFVTTNRPEEKPLLVKDDSAKTFTASIDVYNESFDAATALETPLLLLAVYDADGALVALDTGSEAIVGRTVPTNWNANNRKSFPPSKATTVVTVDASDLGEGTYKAKAFVWNNLNDIKPYTVPSVEQTLVVE